MLGAHDVPWTFKSWLFRFESVDLPIGDLARDVMGDPDFPDSDDFAEIASYVLRRRASDGVVMSVLAEAWSYYLASTNET